MSDRSTTNSGSPVAPGLRQLTGVHVPPGDDAVEGSLDLRVAEARLDRPGIRSGERRWRAAAATRSERAWSSAARLWIKPTSAVLTWAPTSSRVPPRSRELVPGLVEQAAGLRPRVEQFLDALVLGLPAGEVGLNPLDAGPTPRAWPRPRDVGLGHLDRSLGLLAMRDRLLHGRPLLQSSASSSGTNSTASTWPFLTESPMFTVHFST